MEFLGYYICGFLVLVTILIALGAQAKVHSAYNKYQKVASPLDMTGAELARKLAYIGSINDDILDKEEICLELLKELMVICPDKLNEKYKIDCTDKEGLAVYEEICKKRGFLLRGGDFDYTRCANAVIDDFRKGRIGKICLE